MNLDVYARSCELQNSQCVILLGEATFHQVHGGASSNSEISPWEEFHEEYVHIRGCEFGRPVVEPLFLGKIPKQAVPFVGESVSSMMPRPSFISILAKYFSGKARS